FRRVLFRSKIKNELGAQFNIDDHKIIVTYLYAFYEEGNQPDVSSFVERLSDERIKQLVLEIAMLPISDHISEQEINDYIHTIRSQNEAANIQMYLQQQKKAEQQQNPVKAAEIAMQIIEIKKQLKK